MIFLNHYTIYDFNKSKKRKELGPCLWKNLKEIETNFLKTSVSKRAIKNIRKDLDKKYGKDHESYLCAFPKLLTMAHFPPLVFCYKNNKLKSLFLHYYIDEKERPWAKPNLKDHIHKDGFFEIPIDGIVEKYCIIGPPLEGYKQKIKVKVNKETKKISIYKCSKLNKMIKKASISYKNFDKMQTFSSLNKQIIHMLNKELF